LIGFGGVADQIFGETFKRLPVDAKFGVMVAAHLPKHLPGLVVSKVGSHELHVFDGPDDGDFLAFGENRVDINVLIVCHGGFLFGLVVVADEAEFRELAFEFFAVGVEFQVVKGGKFVDDLDRPGIAGMEVGDMLHGLNPFC